jgi:hypothetical protein
MEGSIGSIPSRKHEEQLSAPSTLAPWGVEAAAGPRKAGQEGGGAQRK